MGLWKFLKWTFQKRDTTSGEDFGLSVFQREGVDMFSLARWEVGPHGYSLWLEIWQALMAGQLCVSHVECWSYRDKREEGRKTEIFYKNTFPMCYAQDHLRDHAAHTLLTDGWKDIYSVGTGIDRQMIKTLYTEEVLKTIGWTPYDCTPSFFALKSLPEPVTFDTIKESAGQPGLYSMCYDSCENWLDITLPDEQTKQFVIETIRAVLSAHGKSLWVQGEDE